MRIKETKFQQPPSQYFQPIKYALLVTLFAEFVSIAAYLIATIQKEFFSDRRLFHTDEHRSVVLSAIILLFVLVYVGFIGAYLNRPQNLTIFAITSLLLILPWLPRLLVLVLVIPASLALIQRSMLIRYSLIIEDNDTNRLSDVHQSQV